MASYQAPAFLLLTFGAFAACFLIAFSPSTTTACNCNREIIVGGAAFWRFGFNYSDWALQMAPFHVNDTLVFVYGPSLFSGAEVIHNVLLLHSHKQFEKCNFYKAIVIANTTDGYPGFKYKLSQSKPYYFACGIGEGFHCHTGLMKFKVLPI